MSNLKDPTELSGLLGESLSVRKIGSRVVIKNRPRRAQGKPSAKQEAFNERFKEAVQYARTEVNDPESKLFYTGGITQELPF